MRVAGYFDYNADTKTYYLGVVRKDDYPKDNLDGALGDRNCFIANLFHSAASGTRYFDGGSVSKALKSLDGCQMPDLSGTVSYPKVYELGAYKDRVEFDVSSPIAYAKDGEAGEIGSTNEDAFVLLIVTAKGTNTCKVAVNSDPSAGTSTEYNLMLQGVEIKPAPLLNNNYLARDGAYPADKYNAVLISGNTLTKQDGTQFVRVQCSDVTTRSSPTYKLLIVRDTQPPSLVDQAELKDFYGTSKNFVEETFHVQDDSGLSGCYAQLLDDAGEPVTPFEGFEADPGEYKEYTSPCSDCWLPSGSPADESTAYTVKCKFGEDKITSTCLRTVEQGYENKFKVMCFDKNGNHGNLRTITIAKGETGIRAQALGGDAIDMSKLCIEDECESVYISPRLSEAVDTTIAYDPSYEWTNFIKWTQGSEGAHFVGSNNVEFPLRITSQGKIQSCQWKARHKDDTEVKYSGWLTIPRSTTGFTTSADTTFDSSLMTESPFLNDGEYTIEITCTYTAV